MTIVDEIYMEGSFYGQRNLRENLMGHVHSNWRKRVRRLMRINVDGPLTIKSVRSSSD